MLTQEQRAVSPHWTEVYDGYETLVSQFESGVFIEKDQSGNDLVPLRIAQYKLFAKDAENTIKIIWETKTRLHSNTAMR